MELPPRLRAAIDAMLQGVPLGALQAAGSVLSQRYRAETRDGRLHLSDDLAIKAYLATRMPATFAAVRASFDMLDEALPDFAPATMLDVGAGPGTALWAASDCWPQIASARMIEASRFAALAGRTLARELPGISADWQEGDAARRLEDATPADLVTLCYVLDELAPDALAPLVRRLWALAKGVLVIVEPGTPAGWRRVQEARKVLVDEGANIAAPCPHHLPCPLDPPDWCHFAQRVARSRMHRMAKGGEVPWEDEKFILVAATRSPPSYPAARVIAPPRQAKGRIDIKLCLTDGTAGLRTVTKREGDLFRTVRRADWGDALEV